jgi:hypothetical protein
MTFLSRLADLRVRWAALFSDIRYGSHPLASIPWSSIRRIGQSRLLALTVIVPFLGSLILFNQTVVEALSFSPQIIQRWFHLPNDEQDQLKTISHAVTLSRLYYVYFGLSFLGLASAFFALFCPTTIKDHSSVTAYQSDEAPFVSKPKFRILIREIAREACFWNWVSEESQPFWFGAPLWLRRAGHPNSFHVLFHTVVLEIYAKWCHDNPDSQLDGEVFEDRLARPDSTKLAYAIAFPNRMRAIFADELGDVAFDPSTRNDVLALSFMAQDHSRPLFRVLAVSFYALGFTLLLIPTVQTFYRVLSSLLSRG